MIIQEEYVSKLILAVKMKLDKEQETSTLIIAYSANEDVGQKKDNFCEELQNQVHNRKEIVKKMGYLDGGVGSNNGGIEKYVVQEGKKR